MIYDSHCHLSFLSDDTSLEIISKNKNHSWIMGGYQPSEWEHQMSLKNQFQDQIKTCYGLHPWYVKSDEFDLARDFEDLKIWVDQADFIGEVGLDFFGDEKDFKKQTQINIFEKQLQLGRDKPYVFHFVQSHGHALSLLKDYKVRGFVHSFSGSIEVAEQYFAEGILLSFGANILNENFKKGRVAMKELPLEAILVESDTPSHPLDEEDPIETLEKVYQEVAKMRCMDVDELKVQVSRNLLALL